MAIPVKNFGLVSVNTTYDESATSIELVTGNGSRLPATYPYPLTWWNSTDYAHPADDPNKEIVLVTNRSADTLTVTRGQQGTSASTKNTGGKTYRMSLGITKDMWESLQTPKATHEGLRLRSHRDADLAHQQVEMVDVESIIMDDGVELRNDNGEWSGMVADITVSGAGGLDTGTEQASAFYEIFAIAKEDGTRNLLLHISKLWSINTNYPINDDATQGIRSAVDNSTRMVAQGFKIGESGLVPYVEVSLIKVGTPTGKIWFTIETDSAGVPSGTVVATSHAYDVARLSTTAMFVRFPMTNSQVLSAIPTQYHLVAQGTWTVSATNYVGWRMDSSAGTYANGAKALFDSDTSTWTTDTDDDLLFGIAVETRNSTPTLPTGYVKKCFLGWVQNDASSNFIPFLQVDRSCRTANITTNNSQVTSASGAAELIDLTNFIPPQHIQKTLMCFTGTGVAAGLIAIGDLRATDISSVGDTTGAQVVIYSGTTTTRPTTFAEVFVQSVGIMAMGTVGGKLWVTGFEW